MNDLKPCPNCGGLEEIIIESSWEVQLSRIYCNDCGYSVSGGFDEDECAEEWNAIKWGYRAAKGSKGGLR